MTIPHEAVKYIKSLVALLALAVTALGGGGESGDVRDLIVIGISVGAYVIGIIGIAAVMRRDVKELIEWKANQEAMWKEHVDLHMSMTELLGEMKQVAQDSKSRMDRLDDRIERRFGNHG